MLLLPKKWQLCEELEVLLTLLWQPFHSRSSQITLYTLNLQIIYVKKNIPIKVEWGDRVVWLSLFKEVCAVWPIVPKYGSLTFRTFCHCPLPLLSILTVSIQSLCCLPSTQWTHFFLCLYYISPSSLTNYVLPSYTSFQNSLLQNSPH